LPAGPAAAKMPVFRRLNPTMSFVRVTDLDLSGKRVLIREGEAELS
jgi:hypothetical protein